ncbi:hypothetical protein AX17_004814 [Amanita inopinata Kibby_2008]|nr:hypothetical protein AX17_004814 [Amanita inopinata Kibby_2008]
MRFSAPRSASPSPERGKFRGRSSYGLYSDSESESDGYGLVDEEASSDLESVASSSSTNSYLQLSDLKVTRSEPKLLRRSRSDAELQKIEDTIAAIRLRTRHHDPYEEWEQQTRKDAFRMARKTLTESQTRWHDERDKAHAADHEKLASLHAQQMAEVQSHLNALRLQQQKEEQKLRDGWKARDQVLWERIESVIRMEENKMRKKLEEERRAKQEAETRRRLEEEKRRMEEERRRREEEDKRKKEEEVFREKDEREKKEAEEKQRRLEEEKAKSERVKAEQEQRQVLGLSTADEDWYHARAMLRRLKTEIMKVVKGDKKLKSEWGTLRRQITPKIGQLTNDPQAILRISRELIRICAPPDAPHEPILYSALLSSLSKAILMQAETEVTAEIRTAEPLSKVTFNLLENLQGFSEIFFTKLVQRVGGWAIPIAVPLKDYDGRPWKDEAERLKVMGYRKNATGEGIESTVEYCTRVSGIMRVYFHVLKIKPPKGPLWTLFQGPRYWTWFARMVGAQRKSLLAAPAAAQLIHTALAVMGPDARDIWGLQWIKMLAMIYEGVTEGLPIGNGDERLLIGGQSPEGKSAQVRTQLEVERIMSGFVPPQATLFS